MTAVDFSQAIHTEQAKLAYDTALDKLVPYGPEYDEGKSYYGHIIADSLVSLGRSDAVEPWLLERLAKLESAPESSDSINRRNWRGGLGYMRYAGDWAGFFAQELESAPWRELLKDWIPRISPGLAGGSGLGFLRTARVVRNLTIAETPTRLRELTVAMGYWAARHLKLPGILSDRTHGSLTALEALPQIKWQYKKETVPFNTIHKALEGVANLPEFAGVMNLLKIPEEPIDQVTDITKTFCKVYLAHSHDHDLMAPFMMAVIVPNSLRYLVPYLPMAEGIELLRYGWQYSAAIYSTFGRKNPVEEYPDPDEDYNHLADAAIATKIPHIIAFTEVCLREHRHDDDLIFLAAAWNAIQVISADGEGAESAVKIRYSE